MEILTEKSNPVQPSFIYISKNKSGFPKLLPSHGYDFSHVETHRYMKKYKLKASMARSIIYHLHNKTNEILLMKQPEILNLGFIKCNVDLDDVISLS